MQNLHLGPRCTQFSINPLAMAPTDPSRTAPLPLHSTPPHVHPRRCKVKDARFSSKAYGTHEYKEVGIEGRVQFDLLQAIRRDHNLSSYSLNSGECMTGLDCLWSGVGRPIGCVSCRGLNPEEAQGGRGRAAGAAACRVSDGTQGSWSAAHASRQAARALHPTHSPEELPVLRLQPTRMQSPPLIPQCLPTSWGSRRRTCTTPTSASCRTGTARHGAVSPSTASRCPARVWSSWVKGWVKSEPSECCSAQVSVGSCAYIFPWPAGSVPHCCRLSGPTAPSSWCCPGPLFPSKYISSSPSKLLCSRPQDAYLPQRLLDKLMCMYNYIEMARVTGVPMSFLLARGQSIKVFSQILRKTRARGLLVPNMKARGLVLFVSETRRKGNIDIIPPFSHSSYKHPLLMKLPHTPHRGAARGRTAWRTRVPRYWSQKLGTTRLRWPRWTLPACIPAS